MSAHRIDLMQNDYIETGHVKVKVIRVRAGVVKVEVESIDPIHVDHDLPIDAEVAAAARDPNA